jgi:hypothetical protein
MVDSDARRQEINHLEERLADPNLPAGALEYFFRQRAKLLREEKQEAEGSAYHPMMTKAEVIMGTTAKACSFLLQKQ